MVRRIRVPQEFATPSLEVPQGTTEDALGNTVRTPVTRRFRRPLPMLGLVLVLGERVGVRGHRRPHRNEGLFRRIACPMSAVLKGKDTSKAMKLSWLSDGWYLDFGASAGSESVACP